MTIAEALEMGLQLQKAGKLHEAIEVYRQCVAASPSVVEAHFNLGLALQQTRQLGEAIAEYQATLALKPEHADAHNNLAAAYRTQCRYDEAIGEFKRAIECKPGSAEIHSNLGFTLHEAARFDEAMAEYVKATEISPAYPEAHLNMAMTLLLLGDYDRGLRHYEARLAPGFNVQRPLPMPRWDGGELRGKTILLDHEQGFGDTIQFVRYASLLARRGARVLLGCQRELVRVMRSAEGVAGLVTDADFIPPCHVHCPLASLPLMFGTRLETIPAGRQYLSVDRPLIEGWARRFSRGDRKFKVGLAWSGATGFVANHVRSPFLAALAPLGRVEGVRFYSLQKGDAAQQARTPPEGMELVDWSGELSDFAETGALMSNLDLIITSDTSVAHLAGALGRPTWLLLCYVPDWRWHLKREDSPWYATMRLFRQPALGDWGSVVGSVAEELRGRVRG
ncbi:MAG TPA: tetratricopeptide repeat-containing glycosyltransferase family protein [Tepidisphaeraceae bacterium]|nr:tetratricopeptide repeat-containing glycosyltransferase family protein [Tepidisphaeraceae bacterium]